MKMPVLMLTSDSAFPSEVEIHRNSSGTKIRAGSWKIRRTVRRLTIRTARAASRFPTDQATNFLPDRNLRDRFVTGIGSDLLSPAVGERCVAGLGDLFNCGLAVGDDLCVPAEDLGQMLDRTERDAVTGREHQHRDHGRFQQPGPEQFGDARPPQLNDQPLAFPSGRFGKKRPDDDPAAAPGSLRKWVYIARPHDRHGSRAAIPTPPTSLSGRWQRRPSTPLAEENAWV